MNRIEESEQRKTSKNIVVELEVERKHKRKEIIGSNRNQQQDEQRHKSKIEDRGSIKWNRP